VFYLPGLLLISLTTFPSLLGPTFNLGVLKAGLLGLMPTGAGFIKPIVNVFGAKQFHPVVQSSLIEPYVSDAHSNMIISKLDSFYIQSKSNFLYILCYYFST